MVFTSKLLQNINYTKLPFCVGNSPNSKRDGLFENCSLSMSLAHGVS